MRRAKLTFTNENVEHLIYICLSTRLLRVTLVRPRITSCSRLTLKFERWNSFIPKLSLSLSLCIAFLFIYFFKEVNYNSVGINLKSDLLCSISGLQQVAKGGRRDVVNISATALNSGTALVSWKKMRKKQVCFRSLERTRPSGFSLWGATSRGNSNTGGSGGKVSVEGTVDRLLVCSLCGSATVWISCSRSPF